MFFSWYFKVLFLDINCKINLHTAEVKSVPAIMYCKNVKFWSQFYSRAPVLNFDRLRYGSLRFLTRCGLPTVVPEASCWVLSFSEIPARCGLPTVIPLIRKFCSAPAETFSNSKVDGELPGQDVADMYHLDSETSHGDSTLGAIRKGSNKQGPKNHLEQKLTFQCPGLLTIMKRNGQAESNLTFSRSYWTLLGTFLWTFLINGF
jgi:hypothetical protein